MPVVSAPARSRNFASADIAGMLECVSSCAVSPVFVGRIQHLALLDDALAAASKGEGAAVLIGGEAGVGKSRLVSEFASRAASRSGRVLIGGCMELGSVGLPFAPFTAVLRQLVRDLGAAGVSELLPGQASRELARLLPELGEPARLEDEVYQGEARARLFEQVLGLFERLAESGTVTLIIEDAHWADRSTRDLLKFLVGNQRVLRGVLIVVTFRSDELHRTHPLRPLLAELDRISWVERLELPRLSRHEAGGQIAAILDRDPEPALVDNVFRRSEGNPLFVEQLLGGDAEMPESLRDLVLANVERLPDETRDLLRLASAGGNRLGHALLAEVSGLNEDDLARVLRPAVAGNVLLADSDGYAFRHALIREAMHDDLLPGEHSNLHVRYARAITANPALVPDGRAAIALAHHWYAAHDVTGALVSAWQAAADAGRALAHAEQLSMLDRVLELWASVPDAADRIGTDHVGVLEQAVRVTHLTGDNDRGLAFAAAALQELDAGAEPARAALLLERKGMLCGRDQAASLRDLHRALSLVADGQHEGERAKILASLSQVQYRDIASDQARSTAGEALAIARHTGDFATQARALMTLGMAEASCEVDAGLGLLAQARAAASRARDYHLMTGTTINESHLLEGYGAHAKAAEVARAGIAEAHDLGLARTSGAILAINLAEPLAAVGRWDEAAAVLSQALDLASDGATRASLWRLAGDIALAKDDLSAASDAAARAADLLIPLAYRDQSHLPVLRLQIELRMAQGQLDAALSIAAGALATYDLQASPRYAWPLLVTMARAAADIAAIPVAARTHEDAGRAVAVLRAARAAGATLAVSGPAQAACRLTFNSEAERAERPGPPEQDQAGQASRWHEVADAWADLDEPYPQSLALLRAAESELSGRVARAVVAATLTRAAEIARLLGASRLLSEVVLLARRSGASLTVTSSAHGDGRVQPAQPGPVESGPGHLGRLGVTQREAEVLRLLAAGLTNAAIAAELFISVKTVSVHVSNILGKLGAANRGEAAAIAHRLRLFDGIPAA
jgi:DNA-binding NarL/FixJ family response regulator